MMMKHRSRNNSNTSITTLLSVAVILFSGCLTNVSGFAGLDQAVHFFQHHDLPTIATPMIHSTSLVTSSASAHVDPILPFSSLLMKYKEALATNPLQTKMLTGATLAITGDAIAQSRDIEQEYDGRRAASFGVFDMAYRATQHFLFPPIVQACHGQYILGSIATAFPSLIVPLVGLFGGSELTSYSAAMEQSLASQLLIVPFIYYPIFFALTGAIQGLSAEESVERAKEKFFPLMQRNLLFWIPVQFVQFGFVEENLQIPFLSLCGLGWTFIISVMAGAAKTYKDADSESEGKMLSASDPDELMLTSLDVEVDQTLREVIDAEAAKEKVAVH